MSDAPVVIVGAGLAGYTLARELRKLAPDLPITLVTADSGALYSKPMLSNALAQGHAPAALVQGTPADQAAKLAIEVRGQCRVQAIRRAEKVLDTEAGPIPYGRLVLALGARPRGLAIPGGERALSVNHLDDYARFRERLAPAAHVCILGAGLVGCEFANDLAASGHRVTLVEPDVVPLARMLPAPLSDRLRQGLAAAGVDWRCGAAAVAIEAVGAGYGVFLTDGTSVQADLVLAATGLEPETDLARAAGLAVGRGIVADRRLATCDPDIFALGDCVEVAGHVLLYVLPLMQQARTLAANLAGAATDLQLAAMPVAVKTPACPLVVCPPPAAGQGAWQAERDDAAGASYHFRDAAGALLGFALAGDACGQRRQLAGQVPAVLA
ncbi:FAD-dependent oxidoreductase [Parasulfuritortus cantonensis]|uniref:FAD-dependent oxidoreductase n=1 Tax=Parasulfuritortus cantonensis TaxID=2528202 RepID=A0A4V2NV04_9PROT|nr:FAD-dependent oxidoreductase [Parasulfuritortus cantonensis]TCJ11646.1 FAD-dependent oxidoreductase [Parasulfuritortus cantonensis]